MIIKNNKTFHLIGKNISYIMAIGPTDDLLHVYFGKKLRDRDYSDNSRVTPNGFCTSAKDTESLEARAQEYPAYGYTDLRHPAYVVNNADSNNVSCLKFKSYTIEENSIQEIKGMPHFFLGGKSAQTLKITLYDEITDIETELAYTVFDEYDIILRSAVITNKSTGFMSVESAYSANLDLPQNDYDAIYFPGGWAKERELVRQPVTLGTSIDLSNARGGSGHDLNPFVMISERNADENYGNVYGFSLVYSGNHSTYIDCDKYGNVRVQQGINPFQFRWTLDRGESFQTPQTVLCFSSQGIGGISREMSDAYRSNLCRSKWTYKERPILINNWEATYFDFNEDKLLDIAKKAKETGMELFVLDDGWFGKRNDDTCALGDWFVNIEKLPSGINGLAKKINDIGLKFGLWIEPEMVNPDSDLYREHPDWAIQIPNRTPALCRNQLILDFSKPEVCDYIIEKMCDVIAGANIEYIKWDMNRSMSDMPFVGFNHEFYLGFYKVIDAITSAFPNVLFEGCSGGGGRFDAGILAYMPQIWTSDNSDAVARLKIQYSTSMGYPASSISAHVSAVPNHQVGRITPLKTRADVAYMGAFGYELDITKMSDDEIKTVKEQVNEIKKLRGLSINGDFLRLISPYDTNYCAWAIVSKDKSEAYVMTCKILGVANTTEQSIKLPCLDIEADYTDMNTNTVYGGDELAYKGFTPSFSGDFSTYTLHLKRI